MHKAEVLRWEHSLWQHASVDCIFSIYHFIALDQQPSLVSRVLKGILVSDAQSLDP